MNAGRNIKRGEEWCLVEEYAPGVYLSGKNILSLTPEASYALGKSGLGYSIMEDHYDEKELWHEEEEYFRQQLSWFARFDALMKENIPYCFDRDIDPATAHYYRVKCFIDSVILNAVIFSKFIQKTCPVKVRYFCKAEPGREEECVYGPFDRQGVLIRRVAEKVCGKYGVIWEKVVIEGEKSIRSEGSIFCADSIKTIAKVFHLKSAYNFFRFRKFLKINILHRRKDLRVLCLHSGCVAIDELIRKITRVGGDVYLKNGSEIEHISRVFQKKCLDLKLDADRGRIGEMEKYAKDAAKAFSGDKEILEWIDSKCGIDASDIVGPYFRDLIERIFLRDIVEFSMLEDFYRDRDIDFVITRSSSEEAAISSLMAAKASGKRVCFQHSCGAFEGKRGYLSELVLFDHYFAMHSETEAHMNKILVNDYVGKCCIYQDASQLRAVRKKWEGSVRDSNTVMYVPTKLFVGFRMYNGYLYPLTWYFELQKAFIDLFASRKDVRFVFKFAPGQDWAERSILKYIEDKSSGNISVESRPVSECLGEAGRVLLDFPSTSLYETAAVGIPVMSLSHRLLGVRKEAEDLFKGSIREFSDIPEAVDMAGKFLDDDPERYKVDIPMRDVDVVEKLCEIKSAAGRVSAADKV